MTFQDDGTWPDTTRGDGVYTAKIVLEPQETRKKAEYRVFIQARSNDKTAFVPPAENYGKPDQPRQDPDKKAKSSSKVEDKPVDATTLPKVPRFQRATSVNFQVEGSDRCGSAGMAAIESHRDCDPVGIAPRPPGARGGIGGWRDDSRLAGDAKRIRMRASAACRIGRVLAPPRSASPPAEGSI